MRQSACFVINLITVDNFAVLFNCSPEDRASDSMMAPTESYSFLLFGTRALSSVAWSTGVQLMIFLCFRFPVVMIGSPGRNTLYLLSPPLCFLIVLKRDLFVYRDGSLKS